MKIALVRHGETIYNQLGKMQGTSNIPLSDKGRNEAQSLRKELKDIKFDLCYASPLIRTVETAMILVGDKTLITTDKRLIERNIGNLEGKFRKEYDQKKYWDYKLNNGDEDVEKIQDLFQRVSKFIDYLKENHNDKNILIVSHSAVIRAIHHILKKTNLNSNLIDFDIPNCYYEEIEID